MPVKALREHLAATLDTSVLVELLRQSVGSDRLRIVESCCLHAVTQQTSDRAELLQLAEDYAETDSYRISLRILETTAASKQQERAHALCVRLVARLCGSASPARRVHGIQALALLPPRGEFTCSDAVQVALQSDADPSVVAAVRKLLAARPEDKATAAVLVRALLAHRASSVEAARVAKAFALLGEFPALAQQGRRDAIAALLSQPAKAMGMATMNPSMRLEICAAAVQQDMHYLAHHMAHRPGDDAVLLREFGVCIDRGKLREEQALVSKACVQLPLHVAVQWVDSLESLRACAEQLKGAAGPLALDCEWRPAPDGLFAPVQILQLARPDCVMVIDLQSKLVR
jgi:hypothetical protein